MRVNVRALVNDPVARQVLRGQVCINLVVLLIIGVPTYLAVVLMPSELAITTVFVAMLVFLAVSGLAGILWS